jgi:hypothetical protein
MDHRSLAMTVWGMTRLQSRPSKQLLDSCLAATSRLLRQDSMTLLSLTTILSAVRSLQYLPPLPWMIEACSAARSLVNTDLSPKPWQRKDCVRRLEDVVSWFNLVMQQQQQQGQQCDAGGAGGDREAHGRGGEAGSSDRSSSQQGGVMRTAAGVLGSSSTSSEAMIAAAVGVAAAVAQQWHP